MFAFFRIGIIPFYSRTNGKLLIKKKIKPPKKCSYRTLQSFEEKQHWIVRDYISACFCLNIVYKQFDMNTITLLKCNLPWQRHFVPG